MLLHQSISFAAVAVNLLHSLASAHPTFPETFVEANTTYTLIKRGTFQRSDSTIQGQIPDCGDFDASYANPTSSFGEDGFKIAGDDCSGGKGGKHCWTSWHIAGYTTTNQGWEDLNSDDDCDGNDNCKSSEIQPQSDCTEIDFNGHFGGDDRGLSSSGLDSYLNRLYSNIGGYTWRVVHDDRMQFCTSPKPSGNCQWYDYQCHSKWKSLKRAKLIGYIRRSCVGSRPGTTIPQEQQVKREDGFYTVGRQDFSLDIPAMEFDVGCEGMCGDSSYPGPNKDGNENFSPVT